MLLLKMVSGRISVFCVLTINLASAGFVGKDERDIYDIYNTNKNQERLVQLNGDVIYDSRQLEESTGSNEMQTIGKSSLAKTKYDVIKFRDQEHQLDKNNADDEDEKFDDIEELFQLLHFGTSRDSSKIAVRSLYKKIQKFYLPVPRRFDNRNCTSVVNKFLLNLTAKLRSWALLMGDSWGKFPDGYMFGNVQLMGMYEECIRIEGNVGDSNFTGKYCTIYYKNDNFSLKIPSRPERSGPAMVVILNPLPYHYATCMPSVCNSEDLEMSINETFTKMGRTLSKVVCTDEDHYDKFDAFDIVVSVILSIIIFLVILGTITHELFKLEQLSYAQNIKPLRVCLGLLSCFSISRNFGAIFKYRRKTSKSEINSLHGIRVITLLWIIVCHQYEMNVKYSVNTREGLKYQKPLMAQLFTNGYPAVDTFFFLSGLLLTYRLLPSHLSGEGFGYYQAFIRRIVRLAPSIFIVSSFSATLLRFLGFGPRNPFLREWSIEQCRPNWWKDPLFIDNYVIGDTRHGLTFNDCLGHCWYTAVEMQLFLILPIILIPLHYNFDYGLLWLGYLTAGSMAVPCIVIAMNEFPPIPFFHLSPSQHFAFLTKYYFVPWCRASPYFIGIWTGIFLVKRPKKMQHLNKIVGLFGCAVSLAVMGAIVLGLYPYNIWGRDYELMSVGLSTVYATFSRPAWALALCWFVIVCHYGAGGFVQSFLEWWGWQPLSRLTFCMYLVSPVVQLWWSTTLFIPVYFHYLGKLFEICGVFFITFVISTLLSAFVERPLLNMTRGLSAPQGIMTPHIQQGRK